MISPSLVYSVHGFCTAIPHWPIYYVNTIVHDCYKTFIKICTVSTHITDRPGGRAAIYL